MRDKITYEWVCEEVDEYGDIVDPIFSGTLKEALQCREFSKYKTDIALVRFEGNEEDGENNREYAYLTEDGLPEEFEDSYKIPVRYQQEINKR